ncbi:hypothetical protein LC605_25495 [Nostoc sp. CHAB 5836]|uniref:hypothetical protein n=1 Tax=Nostoc sp. CHAB 5836 TaxID=2780404 RepID=UPI001E590130|nr:hypothetical protein [Nostoc sp. CHAB 5836]MCC5618377.1 hypothetical protein [Nostoc sp. CHAB 5836]
MSQQKPPLFDLFILMREELGLPLTIDQYYLLLEALKGGFGIASREELKKICRLLWIKSQFSRQAENFEECFDEYFKRYDERVKPAPKKPKDTQEDIPSLETPPNSVEKDESEPLETPPEIPSKGNLQVPIAIRGKLLPKKLFRKDVYQLSARDFPVTERQIQQSWRYLRRPIREGALTEIDIEATIQQVCQQGIFLQPVLISNRINRAELLLLIDVSNSMVPFYLLSQQLVDNLKGGRLGKADIYYFRNCPGDYLYFHPQHPQAKLIHDLLPKLHSKRTVALIISDGGAARGGVNQNRIEFTEEFIKNFASCVRYIAWLNPIPEERWLYTTAQKISEFVQMFELNSSGLKAAIRSAKS